MARQVFSRPGVWVESNRGLNGRHYVAWKPHAAQWFDDRKTMLKWLAWPAKTPTGDELRTWLDGLERPKAEASAAKPILEPEGLDNSDPQHATRTII